MNDCISSGFPLIYTKVIDAVIKYNVYEMVEIVLWIFLTVILFKAAMHHSLTFLNLGNKRIVFKTLAGRNKPNVIYCD